MKYLDSSSQAMEIDDIKLFGGNAGYEGHWNKDLHFLPSNPTMTDPAEYDLPKCVPVAPAGHRIPQL
jgi:hypothetical protein